MRYLLAGNGLNLQFDSKNYSPKQLVLRVLKNCNRDDFPKHIIVDRPHLLQNYIAQLFLEGRKALIGEYDRYALNTAEKQSLKSFKERYGPNRCSLRITDIGFEDYYLLHDLVCHRHDMVNPEQYQIREAMRIAYLHAIYNDGALCELYRNFPSAFIEYLRKFDSIFTTNYDSNIESATGMEVYHLHGQFDRLDEVYDASSLRNALPDAPIKDAKIDPSYFYLYSTALSTYCGAYKEFQIKQAPRSNKMVADMSEKYQVDPEFRNIVDNMTKDSNHLTANMGYAIQAKAANPTLRFTNDYHIEEFQHINGTLEVIGLSASNDDHIFGAIDQSDITGCIYYYHGKESICAVEKLLSGLTSTNRLKFISVKEFWEKYA